MVIPNKTDSRIFVFFHHFAGMVFRTIVNDQQFKIRKRLRQYALDALADVTGGIISWNAYGYDRGDLLCFHSVHVI